MTRFTLAFLLAWYFTAEVPEIRGATARSWRTEVRGPYAARLDCERARVKANTPIDPWTGKPDPQSADDRPRVSKCWEEKS